MTNENPIIAVFGGSFDPPHLGHKEIVQDLLVNGGVGLVIVVPTFHHVLKNGARASYANRLLMCRRSLGRTFGDRVIVSQVEQRIGDSRTYSVLQDLKGRYPHAELRLVVGSDIILERQRWYRWDDIQRDFGFIVYDRPGYPVPMATRAPVPHGDLSSIFIREIVSKGGDLTGLVDPSLIPTIQAIYCRE